MITAAELEGLRELAAQRSASMATPRLLELAAELSLLERCMEHDGASKMEIAAAKYRHAAANEAGAWDFDFVRRLVRMGLPSLGISAMSRIPSHALLAVLMPSADKLSPKAEATVTALVHERDEARREVRVLAEYIADTGHSFRLPEHVAQIVARETEG